MNTPPPVRAGPLSKEICNFGKSPNICFRSVDRISPKGFAETFEVYELRGEGPEASPDEARETIEDARLRAQRLAGHD